MSLENAVCFKTLFWLSPILALKISPRRLFGYHDNNRKKLMLLENSGNHVRSQNPKWRRAGNLNAKFYNTKML